MKKLPAQLLLVIVTASLLLAACSSPTITPTIPTQEQVTIIVDLTPVAPTSTLSFTPTPLPTYTPLPQIITPTQALAPTTLPTPPPTSAATPLPPATGATALVNANTNCRSGPSTDYPVIVVITKGVTVTVVSKTTLDDYLLVGAPNNTNQTCWLWTQYATINGDLSGLPVATPPPPLLSFNIAFDKVQACSGGYILEFAVNNTGPKTLQAYKIAAKDLTAKSQQTTSSTVFDYIEECVVTKSIGYIDTGQAGYVYAENFTYDPSGHSMEATVTICSHDDMTGVCAGQLVKFTP